MKALVCENFGPPETLRIADLPDPVAGEGEALIDISYAGLNFFDLLIIENKYQIKPPLPFSPAGEFSGRIAALGPGASGFKIGDRVLGHTGFGCAAERIAIPVGSAGQASGRAFAGELAAGLSITYGTTLHAA